jgi:hypothetical protein
MIPCIAAEGINTAQVLVRPVPARFAAGLFARRMTPNLPI